MDSARNTSSRLKTHPQPSGSVHSTSVASSVLQFPPASEIAVQCAQNPAGGLLPDLCVRCTALLRPWARADSVHCGAAADVLHFARHVGDAVRSCATVNPLLMHRSDFREDFLGLLRAGILAVCAVQQGSHPPAIVTGVVW